MEKFYRKSLLKLRSYLSHEAKGGSSWSFSDKELNNLLKAQPRKLSDFKSMKISGFPANGKRVESYGLIICDIFNGRSFKDFSIKETVEGNLSVKGIIETSNLFSK